MHPGDQYDRTRSHPGYGAVPDTLGIVFRLAETGETSRQCDLFEDLIENDAHLRGLFESRIQSVAGKTWQVQAGGDAPIDIKAAELLDAALRRANTNDLITHQLWCRAFGWSGSHIRWGVGDEGAVVPLWFDNAPHRRFRFEDGWQPRLLSAGDTKGQPLAPGEWVFATNTASGLISRAGLMRTASWSALFKRMCTRDWVIFCDKHAIPTTLGFYPEDAADDDLDEFERKLEEIGEAGTGMFPEGFRIDVQHEADKATAESVFGALINQCNYEMSKLISGGTLNIETQGIGSHAQATTHADRAWEGIIADSDLVSNTIERDVAMPMLQFNSGLEGAKVPRLKIAVVRDMTPLTRAKIASILQNEIGLTLDEDQLRQEFQFRSPAPGSNLGGPKGHKSPTEDRETDDLAE